MADPISPAVSERICKHMNDDHSDAICLYARVFGNVLEAETARMLSIDPKGMNLSAQVDGKSIPVRIEFENPLQDSEDAHQILIKMIKEARKKST